MSTSNWMGTVAPDVRVSRLPLPGTHDSGSLHYIPGHDFDQCQDKSYLQQLEMGVRFLDIRLVKVVSDKGGTNFAVHHSHDYQWSYFDRDSDYSNNPDCTEFVLQDCFTFLDKNPTECIVMSIKQEEPAAPVGEFEDAFMELLKRNARWPRSFWVENWVPTVVQASGRILFVNRLDIGTNVNGHPYVGILWPNWDKAHSGDGVDVEDHYLDVLTAGKWGYVKDHLDKSLAAGEQDENWYVTFVSCAPGASPKSWADTMNPLLVDYLQKLPTVQPRRGVGTVLMDFVPQAAIDHIISQARTAYPPP